MRKSTLFLMAAVMAILVLTVLPLPAHGWDLGISYQETCDGFGITVNPEVYRSGKYKYVPYETQVNQGGGWNPVPYSDYNGDLNPWNPSGQHNYQVKIRYRVYKWTFFGWRLQSYIHTEGPVHKRLHKPDNCYEVCSQTVEQGPEVDDSGWSPWTYNPATGMEESTRTITYTYTLVDARDGETVCGTRTEEEVQTETRWPRNNFNLTSLCRLADGSGQLMVTNNSLEPQSFVLRRMRDGYEISGMAPIGNTTHTVPYGLADDIWILYIANWDVPTTMGDQDYCEAQYQVTKNTCDRWEVSEFTSPGDSGTVVDQGEWTDPYETEYADSHGFHIVEPDDCKQVHKGLVGLDNDCNRWQVFYILDDQKVVVYSGVWVKPNSLETANTEPFEIPMEEGQEIEISDPRGLLDGEVISEPSHCFVCGESEKYRMMTLVDDDAPEWYLGHGGRNGTCYVIMHDDSPGVATWRQADICSVCAHPDFVYEADRVLYDAWVMIDCKGNIHYPDPMWKPEWYRADHGNFCRQESCLNPEVKPPMPVVME